LPDPIYDDSGERLPATYANFLITPDVVLMPTYGQPINDERALQMMKIAFPDHRIIGIDCNALIKQHGSLHCVTMQLHTGTIATR
ncbi:MAG: agmatine deiminase family protein, partial [Muribaculaceae bacterium]|nr:agmatine deiminase family protein [Muribaculaceae bacterium]